MVCDVPEVGRLGVAICYDQWFPEVARTLAWKGAEVILHGRHEGAGDHDLDSVPPGPAEGPTRKDGVLTATTDVKFFHLYGKIPSTCYGPTGENIHGVDEWVSIESRQRVAAVYALSIARWCGVRRLA